MSGAVSFVLGCLILANTIYGVVLLRRTMPKNWIRAALTVAMLVPFFYLTALWAVVYVPWTVWKRRRASVSSS